jgi:hypothetical protein
MNDKPINPADYGETKDCCCPDAERTAPRKDKSTWTGLDEFLAGRLADTAWCPLCQSKTQAAAKARHEAWRAEQIRLRGWSY